MSSSLLSVQSVSKSFPVKKNFFQTSKSAVKALNNISLELSEGQTLGLVGESGCGKSTLGRIVTGLIPPTSGRVLYRGREIDEKSGSTLRGEIQMVFQEPYASLNPRLTVSRIVDEPLRIHTRLTAKERCAKTEAFLSGLGFQPEDMRKYPHEFSGGQCQRIGIARAFILDPKFVVCDEPLSALDVSIQSQILNVLMKLQKETHVAYLFISHDISVVRHVSDRVAVMYLGHLMEEAENESFFRAPLHPYSIELTEAVPSLDPDHHKRQKSLVMENLPSPLHLPTGCPYHPRCDKAMSLCGKTTPKLTRVEEDHRVACHLYG